MSKIDWSKAPDGAEYARKFTGGVSWYRATSNGVYEFFHDNLWHVSSWNRYVLESELIKRTNFQPFTSIEDAQPEGRKLDGGKAIMGAIPPDAELAVARVLTFGAEKYARDNWRKVPDMDVRYMDAALRHLNAYRRGESVDSESGESHLAHAACCIMFLLQTKEESK